ncbi:hypothetical protein FJZ40_04225 [Candidatus Shapirobacteria bacterium]|nr:hypothetical protein [Candidatus Shapirobacteria bacterium]
MVRIEALTPKQKFVAKIEGDGEAFELEDGKVAVMETCTAAGLDCPHTRYIGKLDAEGVRGRAPQFCPAHPETGVLKYEGVAYGSRPAQ